MPNVVWSFGGVDQDSGELLVDVNHWQLVGRFPMGGGPAEGAARAFGTGCVFIPIGALIVDFVLTITISVAAAVSALIAYLPALAPLRIVLGLALEAMTRRGPSARQDRWRTAAPREAPSPFWGS